MKSRSKKTAAVRPVQQVKLKSALTTGLLLGVGSAVSGFLIDVVGSLLQPYLLGLLLSL